MHDDPQFEELLNGYVDGQLSADQRGQLDEQLRADPARRNAFGGFLSIEGLLRSRYAAPRPDTAAVLAAIDAAEKETTGRAVLSAIGGGRRVARPARLPLPARRGRGWWLTVAAAAGLLVMTGWMLERIGRVRLGEPAGAAAGTVARVLRVAGGVSVIRGDLHARVQVGDELRAGERLETDKPDGTVTLGWPDGTRFVVHAGTALRLERNVGTAPLAGVFVARGMLEAAVRPATSGGAPYAKTPHAEIRVLGTRFSLRVGPDATRVDVAEGRVNVRDVARGRAVVAGPGRCVVAGARARVGARPDFGGRPTDGLLVLYTFEAQRGPRIYDNAWADPPLDLLIREPTAVRWLPRAGLALTSPTLVASERPAQKIIDACRAANQVTVEAWFRPAARQPVPREPGRIVTLSRDADFSDFRLEQLGDGFRLRMRTTETNLSGTPSVRTVQLPLSSELMHVAYCRNKSGRTRFYVNGRNATRTTAKQTATDHLVDSALTPGDLSTWADGLHLGLGNEFSGARGWLGEYYLVAVYARALSEMEVRQNYAAGLPQRAVADSRRR